MVMAQLVFQASKRNAPIAIAMVSKVYIRVDQLRSRWNSFRVLSDIAAWFFPKSRS